MCCSTEQRPAIRKTIALLTLALFAALPAISQENAQPQPEAAVKLNPAPFLPIGCWFEGKPAWLGVSEDPIVFRQYLDRAFTDLARIGLNSVTIPNVLPQHEALILEVAAAHGLQVVFEANSAKELITETPAAPEVFDQVARQISEKHGFSRVLLRYQIRDEPSPALMPAWLAMQSALAKYDPQHPSFSCFNNPESLKAAREAGALSEAVFDIYPLKPDTAFGDFGAYRERLDQFLEAADGLPSWIVLQAFSKENAWRYPQSVELRYMTYYALTKGVKGFFFFIYQTLPQHPENLQGMVDAEMVPRPIYAEVQRLSRRLNIMYDTVLNMQRTGPFAIVEKGVDAGYFRTPDGAWCIALVNQDLEHSRYIPVRLADWVRPKPNRMCDAALGNTTTFRWGVGPPSTRILLGPGEGTIIRFWNEDEIR